MNVSDLIQQLQACDPNARVRVLVRDCDHDWILYDEDSQLRMHDCGDYIDIVGVDGSLDTEDEEDE